MVFLPSNTSKSIDTNIDRLQTLFISLAVDNISEFRLQGCSTNKESIDIFLGRKTWCSGGIGRSSIKDTGFSGNIGSSNFTEVLTDGGMGVLGLFWCGGESSSDGPDWLVGNNNILPIFFCKSISISLNLRENEVVGGSSFSAFEWFSTTCDDLQTFIQSILGFGGSFSITFALSATLRMSDKCPLKCNFG